MTYPNGDRAAFVSVVYDAAIVSGDPAPDHEETSEVGWFGVDDLPDLELNDVNHHLLKAAVPLLPPVS